MSGILPIIKPAGMTSASAVLNARIILGESRIGHSGTLDPNAAGVLPIALGRATR
ncbi:MAG: tRNA pseudouridine(55) synthase TruB, partial [Firmicutes bacterium]|nr:tRNA pseudouridine(55) synthase TruB [Bacillota bacterium]